MADQPQTHPNGITDPGVIAGSASSDTTLAEGLLVLRKRKWYVLGCILIGILYGIYQAATQPVLYTATGRIEVRSGASNEYRINGVATGGDNHLETEVLILQSESLLLTVAREMNLANNIDFMGPAPKTRRDLNEPAVRQAVLGRLAGCLRISLLPRTDIIRISCVTTRPQLAADIVNQLINSYIHRSYTTRFQSQERVSQWLTGQLDDLKQKVETSQEQLIDLQRKMGVLGIGLDASKTPMTQSANSVDALATAATTAKIARILAESRFRMLTGVDPDLLISSEDATGMGGNELTRLRTDAAETRATLAQQGVSLGARNPQLLALQAHLREVERALQTEQTRLISQSRQAFLAAEANEKQTTSALEEQKNEAYRLRDELVEYTLRQREYDSNRTLYEGLVNRLRAAGVQAGLESLEIDVVDPALKPARVTITPRSTILLETSLFGLIGGLILAFTLESLDTGLRSVAEIEQVTQLPSLAVIPRVRRITGESGASLSIAQSNISVLATSKSQFSEAFRSLRTSLLLATTGHPPKVLLVCSSTPVEGKTTVATNLACIMAQRETRVLLIDADLRRPNVHHRFGLNGRTGLSIVLAGASSLEDAVRQVPEVPNLDILCSGPVPPFPTEMLSSEAMHQLLLKCAGIYTHIVIDSPPILSVTDGVILARQADAMILVVRHGATSRNIVRRCRDILQRAGASITGVVLNAVDINAPEYHGYYGYSGYSYSNIDSEAWETGTQRDKPERREDSPS